MATAQPIIWPRIDSLVALRVARATVATLFTLLALCALAVCARRIGGALHAPLPAIVLLGLAGVLGAAATVFRASLLDATRRHAVARAGAWSAVTFVLIVWAIGLLVPGTSTAGAVGFLSLLVAEEAWSWWRTFPSRPRAEVRQTASGPEVAAPVMLDEPGPGGGILEASGAVDETATQWIVRRRDAEGAESIEGWVRADFAPGARHALAHLAICPPLAQTPVCYAEQADGPPAQVRIGQVLPYGVRFEIKLDDPAPEAQTVTVEFSIREEEDERR